ncbi:MAG: glycosyltransferase family 4 protein, partial [Nitrososphaerota archaeon]|nr:glycosyltransferase family 4 protein [Nitrososphaerota archaeon]
KYEGGPRVAFEAGACYTPFVSTRVGILTEMVPNGVGGFYVNEHPKEIAKKISILLLDSKLRQRMGENLREIVLKNFEWNTSIKRYAEAYLKIF